MGGAWTVCRFNRERTWPEKGDGVFKGGGWGLIPQCTLQDKTK